MMHSSKKSYNAAPQKTLLIATFVFGYDYQGYIPLQFFSLYKHYPDYDAIVYVDRRIRKETQRALELIPGYGDQYKVILVDKITGNVSKSQMRAYRWFLYDEVFDQYQYVYIGDIDIYFCSETIPLHEQHIRHMAAQKLAYSNVVRAYTAPPLPKWLCRHQKALDHIGMFTPIANIYRTYSKFFYHKRISGLHFVNTEQYYRAVKGQMQRYFKVYYENGMMSKLYKLKMNLYEVCSGETFDETFLYHLIRKSHLRVPKQADDQVQILMCSNMRSHNFRPHHGLHFGMWRNREKADPSYDKYMATPLCRDFYMQFKNELEQEPVLKGIVENSSIQIKALIQTMIRDFENR